MKFPNIFGKRKMMRGKSKSPEQKFREKKAQVDSFLMDSWLKRLKDDPTLADRISEQKFGSEVGMSRYDGEGYEGQPDLLDVLRQAREAKDLLKDEISGKGSWLSDLAQIMKALPEVLGALPQIQQVAKQQQQLNPVQHQQIETRHDQPQAQAQTQEQTQDFQVSMETLVALSELEPADAWAELHAQKQQGWVYYLQHTSLEEMEKILTQYAEAGDPDKAESIKGYLKAKHKWLGALVEIAHNTEQKIGK